MPNDCIELVIKEMNKEFEYYYEDYKEIDESEIWWIFDPSKKNYVHISNFCHEAGDLAVHYYRNGYCSLYAILLKSLFPEGTICDNGQHMVFYYQGAYYDAGGKIPEENSTFFHTTNDEDMREFLRYGFLKSPGNEKIIDLMFQKGKSVLNEYGLKNRTIN